MAREARLTTSFWSEPSITALTATQQRAYILARTQDDINRCGVVPFRLRRWARMAKDTTVRALNRELAALARTTPPHVVIDEDSEELFVRTWMHHDGILGKPNMVIPLVQDHTTIASPTIRLAVLQEIQRIATVYVPNDGPPLDPADTTLPPVVRGILTVLGHPTTDAQRQRIPQGLAEPIHQALVQGFLEPFPQPLGEPPNARRDARGLRTPAPTPTPAAAPATPTGAAPTTDSPPAKTDDQDQAAALVSRILNGHASTGEKRRLATHVRIALADGATTHVLELALKDWASRDKPQPGLLPSLIGDHLRATHGEATSDQATGLLCAHCGQRIREPSQVARETARHTWPASELDVVDARWWAQGDPRCPSSPSGLHVLAEDQAVGP